MRGVEKVQARQQFDGEFPPFRNRRDCSVAAPSRRAACQFGTDDDGSFWNGPRLMPVFVAQVLGQAMGLNRCDSAMAHAAYRGPAFSLMGSFDEEL